MIMTQELDIDKIINVLSELLNQLNDITPSKKATLNNNEQPSERQTKDKKPSWWVRVREKVKKTQGGSSSREDAELEILNLQSDIRQMNTAFRIIQSNIHQMKTAFQNMTQFQTQMSKSLELDFLSHKLKGILEKTDSLRSRSNDLKEIRRKMSNLKRQIPSLLLKQSSKGLSNTDSQIAEENENGIDMYLPGLHVPDDFKNSSAFEEVVDKFQGLDFTQKLCLLSFAVFPENREVKRTMLMYWWIGEGFLICDDDSDNMVNRILDEFSRKGLVDEVEEERKLKPNSYKMEPHVHSTVVYLAKHTNLLELYTSKGKPTMKKSQNQKVCLVRGSSLQPEAKASEMEPKSLLTVFNSSERYPDFTFKWFPYMDSLRVLYLGRWERTAKRHIEVESTEFLSNMKDLKNLRLASFQGISRIEKLENYICALPKLVILDLRACYNLEDLPDDIGLLENLIYLDVSECFMLNRMPKGIAQLSRLQVLKGFVISQSDDERNCEVKHLVNLKKLSITINKYLVKVENLMESLKGLKHLETLKIAWGARFPEDDQTPESIEADEQVEKKGDVKETGKREDEVSSKKEDGIYDKANLDEGKKHDDVKAESLKSATETKENKSDDQNVEGDGDKRKADLEEGKKKQDEVNEERANSDDVVKGDEKTSPPHESKDMIQNKANDKSKVEKEGDEDKGKADPEQGKNQAEVEAKNLKSENGVEGVKKASPSRELTEEKGDEEKEKLNPEEGKKKDELKAQSSKPDRVIQGDEKISPPQDAKDTIQSKLDRGETKTQKPYKTMKFGKKMSFSEKQKKPDNANETSSPSRSLGMGNETKKKGKRYQETTTIDKLPSSLKKLELECFPYKNPPGWLNPKNLDKLEKLSIKGGKLSRISHGDIPTAENKCGVKILRLKYLLEFKAEWKDLKALFPKMILLEKYQCPKVTFCPTDGNGVWRSQP